MHTTSIRWGALLLLTCALPAGCRRAKDRDNGAGSDVLALDIDRAAGSSEAGAMVCDAHGSDCRPLGPRDPVPAGSLVRTSRGGRAHVAVGAASDLELDDDAAVYVASGSELELREGTAALVRTGSPSGSNGMPVRIRIGDRTAELDDKIDTRLIARAGEKGRAAVTVEKGKIALRGSGGESLMLYSGETVDLIPGRPPVRSASFLTFEPSNRPIGRNGSPVSTPVLDLALPEPPVRGLGRMTARVPGRNDVVTGVRLLSHHVDIAVRDGIARTEIDEEFQNETSQVLEGRYVFPLPTDTSISRLALSVGDKLVEGEIVEKKRAATIFKNIVDDTVRPRDPALLEWVVGGDFSLKVFPLPPHGTRKVKLAYDQVLEADGGRVRYVYPLHAGADRATVADDFSIHLRATDTRAKIGDFSTPGYATRVREDGHGGEIDFRASRFAPEADFVASFDRQADAELELSASGPESIPGSAGERGYVMLRFRADLADPMSPPAHVRRDRVIAIDASHSQSVESVDASLRLALGLVDRMDAGERFAVLVCDSACESYPESGLANVGADATEGLRRFAKTRAPRGSSDLAGALLDAAHRLEPGGSGQIVYVGDGAATSGELSVRSIAERVRPALAQAGIDVRMIGAGRSLDREALEALARELGATYESLSTGETLARRIANVALELRSPVIADPELTLPASFTEVYPRTLPNLRLGEEVVVVARATAGDPGEAVLSGDLGPKPYRLVRQVRWGEEAAQQNALVPRLWALSRIADLEAAGDPAAASQIIDLSKRYHVMSRFTSLLVLENDQMYAAYGIKRRAAAKDSLEQQLASATPFASVSPGGPSPTAALEPLPIAPSPNVAPVDRPAPKASRATAEPVQLEGTAVEREKGAEAPFAAAPAAAPPPPAAAAPAAEARPAPMTAAPVAPAKPSRDEEPVYDRRQQIAASESNAYGDDARPATGGEPSIGALDIASSGAGIGAGKTWRLPARDLPRPLPPSAVHRQGDERWTEQGEDVLRRLRNAVGSSPDSRKKREDLVRGLLVRGRFDEARREAERFTALDPDLALSEELLAYASAATDDSRTAAASIDNETENDPNNVGRHARAARAFETLGDERRACAHWRAAAELMPRSEEYVFQSLRCRARVLDDVAGALADARTGAKRGKLLMALIPDLEAAHPPPFERSSGAAGQLEAEVECMQGTERCPTVLVVAPSGAILSPVSPTDARSSATSVAIAQVREGTYRTVLVGGSRDARGRVKVRAFGNTRSFDFRGGARRTIASTAITIPPPSPFYAATPPSWIAR